MFLPKTAFRAYQARCFDIILGKNPARPYGVYTPRGLKKNLKVFSKHPGFVQNLC